MTITSTPSILWRSGHDLVFQRWLRDIGYVRKVILIRVDLGIHFHFYERWCFPVHVFPPSKRDEDFEARSVAHQNNTPRNVGGYALDAPLRQPWASHGLLARYDSFRLPRSTSGSKPSQHLPVVAESGRAGHCRSLPPYDSRRRLALRLRWWALA